MNSKVIMRDDYSEEPISQSLNDYLIPQYEESIREMIQANPERFKNSTEAFSIADLGTADSKNSIKLFRSVINIVRDFNPLMEISIYLNDLPFQDLNQSAKNVMEGLSDIENVYVHMNAKSFYGRIFQANSIDFFMSNLALFWLSKDLDLPGIKGISVLQEDKATANGRKQLELAANDWNNFVQYRQIELKPHGRIHIGLNTFRKEYSHDDKLYIEHMINAPKRILNDLLVSNGFVECDSALTPANIVRTEEMYFEPFKQEQLQLKWEQFKYTNMEFAVVIDTNNQQEVKEKAMQAAGNFKCWGYEIIKHNLIQRKNVPERRATDILDSYFNNVLPKYFQENIKDKLPEKLTSFNMIISKKP